MFGRLGGGGVKMFEISAYYVDGPHGAMIFFPTTVSPLQSNCVNSLYFTLLICRLQHTERHINTSFANIIFSIIHVYESPMKSKSITYNIFKYVLYQLLSYEISTQ